MVQGNAWFRFSTEYASGITFTYRALQYFELQMKFWLTSMDINTVLDLGYLISVRKDCLNVKRFQQGLQLRHCSTVLVQTKELTSNAHLPIAGNVYDPATYTLGSIIKICYL